MSLLRNTNTHDSAGNPIGSVEGFLNTGNFNLEIAKGNVLGHSLKSKFGRNPAVGTTGFDTIWNGGGKYTGFDAVVAETVTIVSASADDASAGTGLRTLRLYGLDTNGVEQTEDIILNGITVVTSTLLYLRLDTAKGLTAGTLGYNVGDISIAQSTTTAVIFAVVPATYNSTMIAAYTIPSNKTGYLIVQRAAIANKNAATVAIRMQIRQPSSVFNVAGEAAMNSVGTGYVEQIFPVPQTLPAMTDLFIEAEASATVAVSAFFDIILVDN